MTGINGGVQRFRQAHCRGRFEYPIRLAHKSDLHRQALNRLQASLQNRPWGMVAAHAVHSDPDAVVVVDGLIEAGNTALQTAQRIHDRLQNGTRHVPRTVHDRACHGGHGTGNVACGACRGRGCVHQAGHGSIAPVPNHQATHRFRSAGFDPRRNVRGVVRILRRQRNRRCAGTGSRCHEP